MDIVARIIFGVNAVLLLSALGWILFFGTIVCIIVKTIQELRK